MSTRCVVARVESRENGFGFRGRFIKPDGYPSGVGATLWREVRRLGLQPVLELLIDRYNGGWGSLSGCELDLEPVASSQYHTSGLPGHPVYYDDNNGKDFTITETDDTDTEWCYAFDEQNMHILSNSGFGDYPEWKKRAVVSLTGDEPDWKKI